MQILRKYLFYILTLLAICIILLFYLFAYHSPFQKKIIKIGLLFSTTGTMAHSEQPVLNAALLAIGQINKEGGINKRLIVPVIYNAQSNWQNSAALAQRMILHDHVQVIFGCWTSACRKYVKPIIEKYNNLLIYPTQYEGIETSDHIIYLGATPNQQITPAVSWILEHHGKKVFLVGSDYIFPHIANKIITHEIQSLGGTVLGEKYINLGSTNVDAVVQEIIRQKPDAVFNTINGDTNIAFFNRLYELTQHKHRFPVMSLSLSTADMAAIGMQKLIGDYAVWSYFVTQQVPENKIFLQAYKEKYGTLEGINDPAMTIYTGVHLWALAVKSSPTAAPPVIHDLMLRQNIASPAGIIYIDPDNANAWRMVMIGQVNTHGSFDIIWSSYRPIPPIVYPEFKTKAQWDLLEYQLYSSWGRSWENTK